jgi:hypothetical protein
MQFLRLKVLGFGLPDATTAHFLSVIGGRWQGSRRKNRQKSP